MNWAYVNNQVYARSHAAEHHVSGDAGTTFPVFSAELGVLGGIRDVHATQVLVFSVALCFLFHLQI